MITLYGGPTPNARKVAIALEEMGLEWRLSPIDILDGDQLAPAFLQLNPNNKAPVIVEDEDGSDPFVLWESGAILWHLAEKTRSFVPTEPRARAICHQWLMFQMSGVGPMFGQNAHFSFYAKDRHEYSIARYANEVTRLLRVLSRPEERYSRVLCRRPDADRDVGFSDHRIGKSLVADIARRCTNRGVPAATVRRSYGVARRSGTLAADRRPDLLGEQELHRCVRHRWSPAGQCPSADPPRHGGDVVVARYRRRPQHR